MTTVSPAAPGGQIEGQLDARHRHDHGHFRAHEPRTESPDGIRPHDVRPRERGARDLHPGNRRHALRSRALRRRTTPQQADDNGGDQGGDDGGRRQWWTAETEEAATAATTRPIRKGRFAGRGDVSPLLLRRLSDEQLGSRLASGEAAAFDELYRRYVHRLSAYGANLLGDAASVTTSRSRRCSRRMARCATGVCPIASSRGSSGSRTTARSTSSCGGVSCRPPSCRKARRAVGSPSSAPANWSLRSHRCPSGSDASTCCASCTGCGSTRPQPSSGFRRRRSSSRCSSRETGLPSSSSSATGSTASPCSASRRGRSTADERRALKTHLRSCPACRGTLGLRGRALELAAGRLVRLAARPLRRAGDRWRPGRREGRRRRRDRDLRRRCLRCRRPGLPPRAACLSACSPPLRPRIRSDRRRRMLLHPRSSRLPRARIGSSCRACLGCRLRSTAKVEHHRSEGGRRRTGLRGARGAERRTTAVTAAAGDSGPQRRRRLAARTAVTPATVPRRRPRLRRRRATDGGSGSDGGRATTHDERRHGAGHRFGRRLAPRRTTSAGTTPTSGSDGSRDGGGGGGDGHDSSSGDGSSHD